MEKRRVRIDEIPVRGLKLFGSQRIAPYAATSQNRRNPRQGIETILYQQKQSGPPRVRIDEIPVRGLKLIAAVRAPVPSQPVRIDEIPVRGLKLFFRSLLEKLGC